MDDDGEYNDGDIVWVKLSYCWWPGEVLGGDRLTEDFISTLKRRPLAVVKFFEEDSYEYVRNTNFIYKYNCGRKHEFLRKGLEQYRAKNKHMEKFPSDVMHAERATGGDPNIVNSTDFLPQKRESYADIFGDRNKGKGKNTSKKVASPSKVVPVIPVKKHEVRILGQATTSTGLGVGSRSLSSSLASASSLSSTPRSAFNASSLNSSVDVTNNSTIGSPIQNYRCHKCGFESGRQNVIVLHTKYCRAIPLNLPSVKVTKPVPITPEKPEPDTTQTVVESQGKLVASTPKTDVQEKIDKIADGDELVEVIQVIEPVKPTRGGRTPRAAAPVAKSTPKSTDRRRNRTRGRAAVTTADAADDEKVEVFMEVTEEKEEIVKEEDKLPEKDVEVVKEDESVDKDDSKGSKGKIELKNELLADWSEDEQDDQNDSAKEEVTVKDEEPVEKLKSVNTATNSHDTSLEKSVDCSPQLASPVSSGTTIKYRNIPKKQKREFIEVTNDQPTAPVATTVEKSSNESCISTTAAICVGDTSLNSSDKTLASTENFPDRPISAKQRILDRATRGSSKSISSDETKRESPVKAIAQESQSPKDDDSKKETSCFDFKEDEEEEVVLNKSPRRSLSNKRDPSLELSTNIVDPIQEQEELERAKKDAELTNKIESLLCETSLPSLPELPKISNTPSPGPSSSTETTPQLKEEIERNRTLPPKERGKRIFKTRNKIIENEAIALEQSKAIVMDFVKKSHEEELAELLEQQRVETKMSSESPTTTNDDSQESVVSNEPTRFENSEFAAIKSKRTKISQAENILALSAQANITQESSVSSSNEMPKPTEADSLPVSISKEQLELNSLSTVDDTPRGGRKSKQRKSGTPVIEKTIEEKAKPESQSPVPDGATRSRKKKSLELQVSVETPSSEGIVESEPQLHLEDVIRKGRKKRGVELPHSVIEKPSTTMVNVEKMAVEAPEPVEETVKPEPQSTHRSLTPKGRRKRGMELQSSGMVVIEALSSAIVAESETHTCFEDVTTKGRKKKGVELQNSDEAEMSISVEMDITPKNQIKESDLVAIGAHSSKEAVVSEANTLIEDAPVKGRKKRGIAHSSSAVEKPSSSSSEVDKKINETSKQNEEPEAALAVNAPKDRKRRGVHQRSNVDEDKELNSEQVVESGIDSRVEDVVPKGRKTRSVEPISPDIGEVTQVIEITEPEAPKTRRKRGVGLPSPVVETPSSATAEFEKTVEKISEPVRDTTPKGRRKRFNELQSPDQKIDDQPCTGASHTEESVDKGTTSEPHAEAAVSKSRKKRSGELHNLELPASQRFATVVLEKLTEATLEAELQSEVPDITPKSRRKRVSEVVAADDSIESPLEEAPKLKEICLEVSAPKGRKKRSDEFQHSEQLGHDTLRVEIEKLVQEIPKQKPQPVVADVTPKNRKKRGMIVQSVDLDTSNTVTSEADVAPDSELVSAVGAKGRKKKNSELRNVDLATTDSIRTAIEKPDEIPELEAPQPVADTGSKGRKNKGRELQKLEVPVAGPVTKVSEKSEETIEIPKFETESNLAEATPKGRKKRSSVLQSSDLTILDTPVSTERLVEEPVEEIPEPDQNTRLPKTIEDIPQKGRKKRGNEIKSPEAVALDNATSEAKKLLEESPKSELACIDIAINEESEKKSDGLPSEQLTDAEVVEKPMEDIKKTATESRANDVSPKMRRKRGGELDKLDLTALDIPRSRRGKNIKVDEPVVASQEVETSKEEPIVVPTSFEKHRKSKRPKKDEEVVEEHLSKTEQVVSSKSEIVSSVVEESKEDTKVVISKRSKQPKQSSADSTAEDIPMVTEPTVCTVEKVEPIAPEQPDSTPFHKLQPIKMIIKSRGRKSNSELLYESTEVSSETKEDEVKEKLPKSPKSSKRKKTLTEPVPVEDLPIPTEISPTENVEEPTKSPKYKRPKFIHDQSKPTKDDKVSEEALQICTPTDPTDTVLQIAEALIHLPDATPLKPAVVDSDKVDLKPNSSSPAPNAKTINPRKRHLQTLMSSPELVEQPKQSEPVESVIIPEKKKREIDEVASEVAPVSTAANEPVVSEKNHTQRLEEDKFDINNIPIVMDDSELLDESNISTTTNTQQPIEETLQIPTTKHMTKKMVVAKSSNGSESVPKTTPQQDSHEAPSSIPDLSVDSTNLSVKPTVNEQSSAKSVQSRTHSPTNRGATQLVQASSVGQIVITSKGTVFTTQSPTTSTAKSSRSGSPKTNVTPAKVSRSIVSSVSSVGTISSSTSKPSPPSSSPTSHSSADESTTKPPVKICVQSQEILYSPTKSRSSTSKLTDTPISHKKTFSSSSSPKKLLAKKHADINSPTTSGKPLFSTSKGAPITPQPATSSAVGSGKKAHKVIKISPQKLKEFTRLGMVEDKGQGKVLTASGMKKFRQEQYQLQKQQRSRSDEPKKPLRADSVDEEPSTSTPTPPPPSEATPEVVIAAAADSSVKEITTTPVEAEQISEDDVVTKSTKNCIETDASMSDVAVLPEPSSTEENEADATVDETEAESSNFEGTEKEVPSPPVEALEPIESSPVVAVEATPEASESGSNVQESSQLIAVPAENFGGPPNLFYLCAVREEGFVPVNNELLYLDSSNQLVALPEHASIEDIVNQAEVLEISTGSDQGTVVTAAAAIDGEGAIEVGQQNILLNTQDGQQIILDQQSLMALAAGGDTSQLLTPDGQQILLQGSAQELLAALAVSQPGLGIVAAEGTQIIVAPESLIDLQDPPLPGEIIQVNPNTTVETNAVLTKPPIMSTVEVPTKNGAEPLVSSPEQKLLEVAAPTNLDESLAAVIGVPGNPNVPTSLELPITVTNPVIAKTTTSKINPIYPPTTAISAIALDSAVAAAAAGSVIGLPTVAQTGTDSSQDETHETTSSSDDTNSNKTERHPIDVTRSEKVNGKSIDDEDEENRDFNAENDIDEIIPNTPESQMNSHAEISSQFSDDESEAPVPIPNVDVDDEDDNVSDCSEIIPIQPNVVILRNINNELMNNNDNDNSSDMEIDNPEPTSGNEENNPHHSSYTDSANNNRLVER